MGTFVAPMGSAAVAIPAASRWSDRFAALVFVARLNMSGRGEESSERRSQRREEDQVVSGKIRGGLTNLSQVIGTRASSEALSEHVGSPGQSSRRAPISAL